MESWQTRLKAHMRATGITQDDIAKRLGMTQGGVGHWFTSRNEIKLSQFLRLCRAAGAVPQQILFGAVLGGSELIDEIKKLVTSSPAVLRNDNKTQKATKYRGKERRNPSIPDRRLQ